MPLYENAFIYKIKHNEDYEDLNIYIGSTTNFKNRKYQHKVNCNNENHQNYSSKVYEYIRNNGGWDDWVMIPIEQYSCNSKKELEIKERYYIDLLRPTLNKNIPTRTFKERYENNKEIIYQKAKEYYEVNKEIINQKHKEYYENNKEIINQKVKEFYEKNKEIINQKHKEYNKANKEIIYQKVICNNCGCESTKHHLKRHQKSKKCLNNKKI